MVALAFFCGATASTLRGSAIAQDTDADRIAALESRIATQEAINRLQSDRIGGLVVADDQLLPIPRPASDFNTSQYLFTGISPDAVKLFCRANSEMDDRYVSLICDQVATP